MLFWQEITFSDGKLHIVFCDVGQGDAIFIRTPQKTDILVDGGPDRAVLDCLANHMPFWDKTLELVILSHPHQDHFAGLIDVIGDYAIQSFVTEKLNNTSVGFGEFGKALARERISPRYVVSGSKLRTKDGVTMKVLAPSQEFLSRTSPNGEIGESDEFGSLVLQLTFRDFDVLLTSDSQRGLLKEAQAQIAGGIEILQLPHHGSKYGLDEELVDRINPKLVVISVGKNRYGHPSKDVLEILSEKDIEVLRTDQNGTVKIVSDGKTYHLMN